MPRQQAGGRGGGGEGGPGAASWLDLLARWRPGCGPRCQVAGWHVGWQLPLIRAIIEGTAVNKRPSLKDALTCLDLTRLAGRGS